MSEDVKRAYKLMKYMTKCQEYKKVGHIIIPIQDDWFFQASLQIDSEKSLQSTPDCFRKFIANIQTIGFIRVVDGQSECIEQIVNTGALLEEIITLRENQNDPVCVHDAKASRMTFHVSRLFFSPEEPVMMELVEDDVSLSIQIIFKEPITCRTLVQEFDHAFDFYGKFCFDKIKQKKAYDMHFDEFVKNGTELLGIMDGFVRYPAHEVDYQQSYLSYTVREFTSDKKTNKLHVEHNGAYGYFDAFVMSFVGEVKTIHKPAYVMTYGTDSMCDELGQYLYAPLCAIIQQFIQPQQTHMIHLLAKDGVEIKMDFTVEFTQPSKSAKVTVVCIGKRTINYENQYDEVFDDELDKGKHTVLRQQFDHWHCDTRYSVVNDLKRLRF